MRPSFREKLLAFIVVMLGTASAIFFSTKLLVGAANIC